MMPVPPPDAAVARFRDDVARVAAAAFDGAAPAADARIALAVSGGADSMAMLALAVAAFPGRTVAATFDHRLRAASADEAAMVARACAALEVPHRTLAPPDAIAGSSIQMRARRARYAALSAWADAAGAAMLLTAHHADDQAETLLMRLNRGAGVAGLAAIRPWRFDGDVAVLRPLLGWRRAELRLVAQAAAMPFVDDPSNDDPRHDRTRMRALLAATPALDPVRLAASAAWLAEAEAVLARLAGRLWEERWRGPDRPFAVAEEERELRRRLVRRAIIAVRESAAITLPAFDDSTNVEPLLDALEAGRVAVQGGVKVAATPAGWQFSVAPPRRSV
jgi:tRNA(Ile)-lysidine synthase